MFFQHGEPNVALIVALGLGMMCLTFWLVYMAARDKLRPLVPVPGQLVVFRDELGHFGVAKVLAFQRGLVHMKVFSNRWPRPPRTLPVDHLFVARNPDVEDWGSPHVVMPVEQYRGTVLKPLDLRAVEEEELEAVRAWATAESRGGPTTR